MNKEDWEKKLAEFDEMKTKQEANKGLCENTIEELDVFMEVISAKIGTFK